MPRETPRILQRRNKSYLYQTYRNGLRVINNYIGPPDSVKSKEIQNQVAQRKRYEALLKETKAALKEVKKALRGKI